MKGASEKGPRPQPGPLVDREGGERKTWAPRKGLHNAGPDRHQGKSSTGSEKKEKNNGTREGQRGSDPGAPWAKS